METIVTFSKYIRVSFNHFAVGAALLLHVAEHYASTYCRAEIFTYRDGKTRLSHVHEVTETGIFRERVIHTGMNTDEPVVSTLVVTQ